MTARVLPLRRRSQSDPPLGDEAVAAAAATGDPAAVAELFQRFQPTVTRYVSWAIGAGPDVEDLTQATFLQVARGRARFDGRSSPSTWLLGIATNVVRHHRRSQARRRSLEKALRLLHADARASLPPERAEARRQLVIARKALEALPLERRLAFVLCELEGLSAREAARALGASETSVWKRVSVARREIRRAVEGEDA